MSDKLKIAHLLIGGNGLIGTALRLEMANRRLNFAATTRRRDVPPLMLHCSLGETDPDELPRADVLYLIAAAPGFAACEGNAQSWVVNVDAQIALARSFAVERPPEQPTFVVYVSSDAVEWCGITAYARQKAQVESYIHAIDGAVVRPTRVPPDRAGNLAALILDVGLNRKAGVHRWKP